MEETTVQRRTTAIDPDHEIVIIGAGLTGLGVGAELKKSGIDEFVILDRAGDVGGTWRDNHYPGVGVDVPTYAYQFSYFRKPDWSRLFAKGAEVKVYIDDFVAEFELKSHLRFGADIVSRTWDEENHFWRLAASSGEEFTARFVVSAVGAYIERRPNSIAGLSEFKGKVLDPSDWDDDWDPTGQRVAVVGTGATAVQIVPSIAPAVERLHVFQRTPIWVLPKIDPQIPRWLQGLFRRVPATSRLSFYLANMLSEVIFIKAIMSYTKAPWLQRALENYSRKTLEKAVPDPELRKVLTPSYPFGTKRPSMSNDYFQTFLRDNVDLITGGIERFTSTGVVATSGEEREVDAIVLATGFRMVYDPDAYGEHNTVTGRNGFDLKTRFATQRLKSYESVSMPGLPNYFMSYAGYAAVGGAWHPLVENMGRIVSRIVLEARRRGATSVEVTERATDRYHGVIEDRMRKVLLYNVDASSANTYYLDRFGDAPVMRPGSRAEAKKASLKFPLDDYTWTALPAQTTKA